MMDIFSHHVQFWNPDDTVQCRHFIAPVAYVAFVKTFRTSGRVRETPPVKRHVHDIDSRTGNHRPADRLIRFVSVRACPPGASSANCDQGCAIILINRSFTRLLIGSLNFWMSYKSNFVGFLLIVRLIDYHTVIRQFHLYCRSINVRPTDQITRLIGYNRNLFKFSMIITG